MFFNKTKRKNRGLLGLLQPITTLLLLLSERTSLPQNEQPAIPMIESPQDRFYSVGSNINLCMDYLIALGSCRLLTYVRDIPAFRPEELEQDCANRSELFSRMTPAVQAACEDMDIHKDNMLAYVPRGKL